ncbi:MAG TPA: DUF4384 domain-containing protein [Candidatus Angelobacter sp.]|jgi:hypothetical protein|nr:DUF4384 domain-containing protein [Candidatus Angelobacter sp.]
MKMKIACLMIFLASSIFSWADEQSVSAKDLFYAQVKAVKTVKTRPTHQGPAAGRKSNLHGSSGNTGNEFKGALGSPLNTGLRYQLIQRLPDGTEAPVNLDSSFQSGDHIRLSFESNMKGYLYVVQQGSTGNWTVLFPDPRINGGQNTIDSGNKYVVPAKGWFYFDENPGAERLMVFLSQKPLDTLDNFLPGGSRSADPARPTVNQSIVDELNNNITSENVKTRALVFEKDTSPPPNGGRPAPAAYVVNKLGNAVVAEIILSHN